MANILRAVEHPEREAVEKVTRRQVAGDWPYCEASSFLQKP